MGKVKHEAGSRAKSQPAPKPTERKVDEEAEERWRSEGGSQTYDTPDPPISQDTTGNPANYKVNRRLVKSPPRRRTDPPGSFQEGYQQGRQDAEHERLNAGRTVNADSRGPMEYDRGPAPRELGYGGSRFEDQQNGEDDFRSQGDGSEQSGRTSKKSPTAESKSRSQQKRM